MATKTKTKKKQSKPKKTAARKVAPKKRAKKKLTRMKAAPKKQAVKTKAPGKKAAGGKTAGAPQAYVRGGSQSVDTLALPRVRRESPSGEQSGELQGLSDIESADSESVDELLEEGNAFEAEAVKGVEDADDHDEREVHTHEVLEDDVPEEELDDQD